MKKNNFVKCAFFFVSGLIISTLAAAEQRYVTDYFEITLRTGPSGNHTIQRMIKSGAALEVIEQNEENGYSKVRTNGGIEGWVLSRYLMREPAARVQLENLVKQITSKEPQSSSIRNQLNLIKTEYDNVKNRILHLENEKKQLQDRLNEIKSTAANVLAIDAENKQMHQKFVEAKSELKTLQEHYGALDKSNEREWFITGAMVMLGGLVLGLIIPKIRWRRRSRYSDY
ncbi:MAG: TIGR04211 family SH3 domain-containing protein [Nitrosomonas sp.]|nr:TIGR04211 family SH3 domain-containing protein [Nitrosomonas sp.]